MKVNFFSKFRVWDERERRCCERNNRGAWSSCAKLINAGRGSRVEFSRVESITGLKLTQSKLRCSGSVNSFFASPDCTQFSRRSWSSNYTVSPVRMNHDRLGIPRYRYWRSLQITPVEQAGVVEGKHRPGAADERAPWPPPTPTRSFYSTAYPKLEQPFRALAREHETYERRARDVRSAFVTIHKTTLNAAFKPLNTGWFITGILARGPAEDFMVRLPDDKKEQRRRRASSPSTKLARQTLLLISVVS